MSALTLSQMVNSVRSLVGDLGTEQMQTVRQEGLTGTVDGTNKLFSVYRYPVVTGSLRIWKDNTLLTITTDYTVDLVRGEVTMVDAPTLGQVIEASYRFLWFPDDGYHQFIISGAGECGITGTGGTNADLATSLLAVAPEGIIQPIRLFAACHYNFRRADQSAHEFNASAGGQSQSVDSSTKNFRDVGKSFCERAKQARDDFYKDFGARDLPAASQTRIAFKRYQPRR